MVFSVRILLITVVNIMIIFRLSLGRLDNIIDLFHLHMLLIHTCDVYTAVLCSDLFDLKAYLPQSHLDVSLS